MGGAWRSIWDSGLRFSGLDVQIWQPLGFFHLQSQIAQLPGHPLTLTPTRHQAGQVHLSEGLRACACTQGSAPRESISSGP